MLCDNIKRIRKSKGLSQFDEVLVLHVYRAGKLSNVALRMSDTIKKDRYAVLISCIK